MLNQILLNVCTRCLCYMLLQLILTADYVLKILQCPDSEDLEARVLSEEANDLASRFQRSLYRSIYKRVYASVSVERRKSFEDGVLEHEGV